MFLHNSFKISAVLVRCACPAFCGVTPSIICAERQLDMFESEEFLLSFGIPYHYCIGSCSPNTLIVAYMYNSSLTAK